VQSRRLRVRRDFSNEKTETESVCLGLTQIELSVSECGGEERGEKCHEGLTRRTVVTAAV